MDPQSAVVEVSDNNFTNFLASLSEVKRKKKDVEVLVLKNRNEQRTLQLKINREKEKMIDASRKLKYMTLRKAQLEEEHRKLDEDYRSAEDVI